MSTPTTTPAAPLSFIQTVEVDVKAIAGDIFGFFGTNVGETITDLGAEAAGVGVGLGLIFAVNPSNKTATATDINAIVTTLSAELSGSTPPTLAQLQGALSVILPGTSSSWATFAMTFSTGLFNFISKYSGSNWVTVGNDFLKGIQLVTMATLSGAALPTAVAVTPTTTPATTA